jgi:hypothetical protein
MVRQIIYLSCLCICDKIYERVFLIDLNKVSTLLANFHRLKFLKLLHILEQSRSVKIYGNKLLQKYQIDCLFRKTSCRLA